MTEYNRVKRINKEDVERLLEALSEVEDDDLL